MFYVISTDNYGNDYPDEKFLKRGSTLDPPVLEWTDKEAEAIEFSNKGAADRVTFTLNSVARSRNNSRFYVSVEEGYSLKPGFES